MSDYLDTSAFVKLILIEKESDAFRERVATGGPLISSALLSVEGHRAAARYGPGALGRARELLAGITRLPIDDVTLEAAANVPPIPLRSLDALHLAAALSLGDDLERFYCYDVRLAEAARDLGLPVEAPGA